MMRTRNLVAAVVVMGVAALDAPVAYAQPASPDPGRFEVSIGSVWIGRQPLGSNSANETTGAGGTLTLFRTASELANVNGLEGRVGVRMWRGLEAEVEASYGKPQLNISISDDTESATAIATAETIQQIMIGAGVVWALPHRSWSERLVPFVTAGGGYLRQVHDPATLVDTGRFYQIGGGVKVLLVSRSNRFVNGVGVRVDARAVVRSKGVAFDAASHASPAIAAALFLRL
jgi:hypothetical protein